MRPPPAWPLRPSQCSNLNQAVSAAFTNNTTRQNVQAIAQNMVQAFGANPSQKGKATWYGFQVLEAIDTAGRLQGTLQANSNLAVGTFPCMSLGTATLPTSLVSAARGYAALSASAAARRPISTRSSRTTGSGSSSRPKTARGKLPPRCRRGLASPVTPPICSSSWAHPDRVRASSGPATHWSSVPSTGPRYPRRHSTHPYVVVGNCTEGGGFLQHYAFNNSNAAIFGVLQPTQCPD